MLVMVRDRQEGKTSALIEWLLKGNAINDYPGWNRVIVCVHHQAVVTVTEMLKKRTADWDPRTAGYHDLRKAVWSIGDLRGNGFRSEHFDYVIDNAEELIMDRLRGLAKLPVAITVNGKYWQ